MVVLKVWHKTNRATGMKYEDAVFYTDNRGNYFLKFDGCTRVCPIRYTIDALGKARVDYGVMGGVLNKAHTKYINGYFTKYVRQQLKLAR